MHIKHIYIYNNKHEIWKFTMLSFNILLHGSVPGPQHQGGETPAAQGAWHRRCQGRCRRPVGERGGATRLPKRCQALRRDHRSCLCRDFPTQWSAWSKGRSLGITGWFWWFWRKSWRILDLCRSCSWSMVIKLSKIHPKYSWELSCIRTY